MNSRRFLCLLLLSLMCLSLLAGCSDTGSTPTTTTPESTATETGSPDTEGTTSAPTSTPTPVVVLPSSSSLVGTKHMPPIDSQGSIGSCSAQAVTYNQFTVAVSQYVNNVLGDDSWDPSTGLKKYIFSPKFSFVYSGAGTQYSYDILVDQGCLPLTMSTFYKHNDTSNKVNGAGSVANHQLSKCWDVDKGELAKALNYRLTKYDEVEFNAFDYNFNTAGGKAHLDRIKDSVVRGNVVVVCGWSSYWEYLDIEGTGTLGKEGDSCIWLGMNGSSSDGNHAVSIVGYDDDITVTVGGATLKGAFQIANSWGTSYRNDGYVWMMYDSFNRVSGHPELADEGYYSGTLAFYSNESSNVARAISMLKSRYNMLMDMKATGDTAKVGANEYPVFNVVDPKTDKYFSYNDEGVIEWAVEAGENCEFAFIPFEDYCKWANVKITDEDSEYKGSYLICAVNQCNDPIRSACFVSLGGTNTAMGRVCNLAKLTSATNLQSYAFMLSGYKNNGETEFTSSMKMHYPVVTSKVERTGTLYRSSFVNWEDIIVNQSNVIIEVEVEALKREAIKITLVRSDSDGNIVSRVPQIIRNVSSLSNELDTEGDTRFDGAASNGTLDKAYFGFGFNEYAQIGAGYEMDDLLWGVIVEGNVLGIEVRGLRLLDITGKEYASIKLNEADGHLGKGEEKAFYFDLGGGIKSYAAAPAEKSILYNVGLDKYMLRKGASYIETSTRDNKSFLDFIYDPSTKTYKVFDETNKYNLDVKGGEAKEGAQLFVNVPNDSRNTQNWIVETNSDNSFTIKSAADPNYRVVYDKSSRKLILTSKTDNKGADKWNAFSTTVSPLDIQVVKNGNKLDINGIVPEKYTSGDITIRITNKDGSYNSTTLKVTPKDGKYSCSTELPAGTYLFTPVYNGEAYGFEYIFTVK